MASTLLGQLSTIQSGSLVRASVRIWFVLSSSACRFPVSLLKKANIPMVSKTRRVIVRTDSAAKAARRSLLLVSLFSTTGVRRRTSSYVRRPAIKAESKCSLSTRNRAMPVRIQDEIADPGEVLKEIDLPGVLGSEFIVEGSASDQAHYQCRCRKAGLSVGNLFDDAPPCSCRAQYSETPRRWHCTKSSSSLLPASA